MKSTILILCTSLILALNAKGQTFRAKQIGGTTDDGGYFTAVDGAGNQYITGIFSGTTDFDPGAGIFNLTSAGGHDAFLCKLDANGDLLWVKQFGGTDVDWGRSIVTNADGNVFLTGVFSNSVDFDPGPGINIFNSNGGKDIFILKLDPSGNLVWAKQLGSIGDDHGNYIVVDGAGNAYATGHFYGTADFDPGPGTFNLTAEYYDVFVIKLNSSGNLVWARKMGGQFTDMGYAIAVDASGNVYSTGIFLGYADFDPGPGSYLLNSNVIGASDAAAYISKLDASGNFVWAKQLSGWNSHACNGYAIAVDAAGNVFTAGRFSNWIDFDTGPGTQFVASTGMWDGFLLKLNASGGFEWAKVIGGGCQEEDYVTALAMDASGNFYMTGPFQYIGDFDPGPGVFQMHAAGGTDIFIIKLDASGNFLWSKKMGSGFNDYCYSIALDGAGNIYTAGHFSGSADFDPAEPGTSYLTSFGALDIFAHKINAGPLPPDLTSSQFFSSTQLAEGGFIDEVIVVRNVGAGATSAQVSLAITNYSVLSGLTVTLNNAPTVTIGIDTYTLDNANWTFSPVTGMLSSAALIPPGGSRNIGIRIARGTDAGTGAHGAVTQTTTIMYGTGGGEIQFINNSISNTILKTQY